MNVATFLQALGFFFPLCLRAAGGSQGVALGLEVKDEYADCGLVQFDEIFFQGGKLRLSLQLIKTFNLPVIWLQWFKIVRI